MPPNCSWAANYIHCLRIGLKLSLKSTYAFNTFRPSTYTFCNPNRRITRDSFLNSTYWFIFWQLTIVMHPISVFRGRPQYSFHLFETFQYLFLCSGFKARKNSVGVRINFSLLMSLYFSRMILSYLLLYVTNASEITF